MPKLPQEGAVEKCVTSSTHVRSARRARRPRARRYDVCCRFASWSRGGGRLSYMKLMKQQHPDGMAAICAATSSLELALRTVRDRVARRLRAAADPPALPSQRAPGFRHPSPQDRLRDEQEVFEPCSGTAKGRCWPSRSMAPFVNQGQDNRDGGPTSQVALNVDIPAVGAHDRSADG